MAESTRPQLGISTQGSRTRLAVENIKCGGCAKTITKALTTIGFANVMVDPELSSVELDSPQNPDFILAAVKKLRDLGYPLIETEAGLTALALKAKSYLSCAIGKTT